jgi:hypothetical protein
MTDVPTGTLTGMPSTMTSMLSGEVDAGVP